MTRRHWQAQAEAKKKKKRSGGGGGGGSASDDNMKLVSGATGATALLAVLGIILVLVFTTGRRHRDLGGMGNCSISISRRIILAPRNRFFGFARAGLTVPSGALLRFDLRSLELGGNKNCVPPIISPHVGIHTGRHIPPCPHWWRDGCGRRLA